MPDGGQAVRPDIVRVRRLLPGEHCHGPWPVRQGRVGEPRARSAQGRMEAHGEVRQPLLGQRREERDPAPHPVEPGWAPGLAVSGGHAGRPRISGRVAAAPAGHGDGLSEAHCLHEACQRGQWGRSSGRLPARCTHCDRAVWHGRAGRGAAVRRASRDRPQHRAREHRRGHRPLHAGLRSPGPALWRQRAPGLLRTGLAAASGDRGHRRGRRGARRGLCRARLAPAAPARALAGGPS
mmetsp:Transcript_31017/g.88925  ORF Transcript_31017/g.88925 Transcript_31017/m.88925 type:complete len:237 (+) Transcript_31017:958-1668(+)